MCTLADIFSEAFMSLKGYKKHLAQNDGIIFNIHINKYLRQTKPNIKTPGKQPYPTT